MQVNRSDAAVGMSARDQPSGNREGRSLLFVHLKLLSLDLDELAITNSSDIFN